MLLLVLVGSFLIYKFIDKNLNKNVYDKFDNLHNIIFLEYNDTAEFLLKDPDGYISNMTDIDLYARKVNNKDEYMYISAKNAMSFNISEKEKLTTCAKNADSFFRNYKDDYIDGKELEKIIWKFALVNGTKNSHISNSVNTNYYVEYEDGLPHTRENIIFLSKYVLNNDITDLSNILIHEKIHIYQRYNKEKFDDIIKKMGYIISHNNNNKLKRSNPDTNNIIYFDPSTNKEMTCLYRNDKPNNINDVIITDFTVEHPYEQIAYNIADKYNKMHLSKYKDDNI
jgi:hypothetical protein